MSERSHISQIHCVNSFQDLVSTPFQGEVNAICWSRKLTGDFSEIVEKAELNLSASQANENMVVLDEEDLVQLQLSEQGQLAREVLLNDMKLLREYGADPTLNVIKYYERDDSFPFFPTDVYSFHVDRSPVPTNTFLCTYHGESSEIVPNAQAVQKVLVPEIRNELKQMYHGQNAGFDAFLTDHFFDLHYQAEPDANIIKLGQGNLWKLAVDHPGSKVPPCLHRAPQEKSGESRLLLIC